jgi:integrase
MAEQLLGARKDQYMRGEFDPWVTAKPRERLSLGRARELFLEAKAGKRRSSKEMYRYAIGLLEAVEGIDSRTLVVTITKDHVAAAIDRKRIPQDKTKTPKNDASDATRRTRHRHLRVFFNWLIKEVHLKQSPLKGMDTPKEEDKTPQFLNEDQIAAILDVIEDKSNLPALNWLADLVRFGLGTGMRRSEIAHLKWEDFHLAEKRLYLKVTEDKQHDHVIKNYHARNIPTGPGLLPVVERLHADPPDPVYVFVGPRGVPILTRNAKSCVTKQFKYAVRRADLSPKVKTWASFHSLRHTFASMLVQAGVDTPSVQYLMGHKSPATTLGYVAHDPERVRAAVEKLPRTSRGCMRL